MQRGGPGTGLQEQLTSPTRVRGIARFRASDFFFVTTDPDPAEEPPRPAAGLTQHHGPV